MMPVVVNHADSGDHAPQLEAPIHAAKLVERCTNGVHANIQTDPYRDRRRSVEHVVYPWHVQRELA